MNKILLMILASALTTFMIRSVPFVFFTKRKLPDLVKYFGRYLPFALMPLLVVFGLRNIDPTTYPFGLAELLASVTVIGLHAKFNKLFLSISVGTLVYMVLLQIVFV